MLITFDWALLEPNGVHFWRLCFLKFQNLKSDFWPKLYFEVSVPKIWFLENFNSIKKIKKIWGYISKYFSKSEISLTKIWTKICGYTRFFFEILFFLTKIWFCLDKIMKKIWGYPEIFFDIWDFLTKIWKKSGGTKNIFRNLKFFDKNLKKIGGEKSGC